MRTVLLRGYDGFEKLAQIPDNVYSWKMPVLSTSTEYGGTSYYDTVIEQFTTRTFVPTRTAEVVHGLSVPVWREEYTPAPINLRPNKYRVKFAGGREPSIIIEANSYVYVGNDVNRGDEYKFLDYYHKAICSYFWVSKVEKV